MNGIEYWIFFTVESLQKYNLKSQILIIYMEFPVFFVFCFFFVLLHWKVIYRNTYNILHKSPKYHWNFFIKLNFFTSSIFLWEEIPYFLGWISSFSTEMSSLSAFFFFFFFLRGGEDHLCFFDRGVITYHHYRI